MTPPISKEKQDIIRRLYPDRSVRDTAAAAGVCPGSVINYARRMGLRKSPAYNEKLAETRRELLKINTDNGRRADPIARGRKLHHTWVLEYYREWSGEKRRTRLRLQTTTLRAAYVKSHLVRHHAYERCPDEPYTLLYTPATRRRTGRYSEEYYTKRYHLTFREKNNHD